MKTRYIRTTVVTLSLLTAGAAFANTGGATVELRAPGADDLPPSYSIQETPAAVFSMLLPFEAVYAQMDDNFRVCLETAARSQAGVEGEDACWIALEAAKVDAFSSQAEVMEAMAAELAALGVMIERDADGIEESIETQTTKTGQLDNQMQMLQSTARAFLDAVDPNDMDREAQTQLRGLVREIRSVQSARSHSDFVLDDLRDQRQQQLASIETFGSWAWHISQDAADLTSSVQESARAIARIKIGAGRRERREGPNSSGPVLERVGIVMEGFAAWRAANDGSRRATTLADAEVSTAE